MTPQEAIKFFNDEILRLNNAPKINGCEMTDEWKEQLEICVMAKSALEKQIPKKPKINEYGYFICPTCNSDDYSLMYDNNYADRYNHCHNCSQALDWGDSE